MTTVEDSLQVARGDPGREVPGEPDEEERRDASYRVSTPSAAVTFRVRVLFSRPYVTVTR